MTEVANTHTFDFEEAYITEFVYNNEEHGNFSIPVIIWGQDIWFFAKEVSEALMYDDPYKTYQRLCKNRFVLPKSEFDQLKKVNTSKDSVHIRGAVLLPEYDFYALVMRSDAPYAEKFQRWVNHEVLPAIRKTGEYKLTDHSQTEEQPQTYNRANNVQQLVSDVWYTFELYEKFGYPKSEAAKYASNLGEDVHGINVLNYTQGPPPQEALDMSHESHYLKPSDMAKYFDDLDNASEVNKALNKLLLIRKNDSYTGWTPTPKGFEYKCIKVGAVVKWHKDSIPAIRELWRQEKLRYGGVK